MGSKMLKSVGEEFGGGQQVILKMCLKLKTLIAMDFSQTSFPKSVTSWRLAAGYLQLEVSESSRQTVGNLEGHPWKGAA